MHPPPPSSATRRTPGGWWARHWRWAVPVLIVGSVALVAGGIVGGLLRWSEAAHGSAPMREALRRAGCSPQVASLFGEPLRTHRLPQGRLHVGPDGRHDVGLVVGVEGPRAAGRLFVQGTRVDDSWDYPVMYLLADQEQMIDLSALDDEEAALECALEQCRAQGGCRNGDSALSV